MNRTRASTAAAIAILKRDLFIFASYRFRLISQTVSIFFGVIVFYYISRLVGGRGFSPNGYFAFAVVGLAILQIPTSTLTALPITVRQELVAGTFERVLVSPFGAIASVVAMGMFPFVFACFSALLTISFAAAVFGMSISWSTVPLALPAIALGALAFMPFALVLCASVFIAKQAGAGAGLVLTGISLVSGAVFPVALLPGWIEWAAHAQPFTPALDLIRHLLVGSPIDSAWNAAAHVAAFAVVTFPLSLYILRASLRFGQRRGTVMEY